MAMGIIFIVLGGPRLRLRHVVARPFAVGQVPAQLVRELLPRFTSDHGHPLHPPSFLIPGFLF